MARDRAVELRGEILLITAVLWGAALLGVAAAPAAGQQALPSGAEGALERLHASPRHGEWVTIATGAQDSVRAWVVYPETSERAPVVLVVHEIYGLSHWIRAVADQVAAEGYIAVAPDLLTTMDVPAGQDGAPEPQAAVAAIRTLAADEVHEDLRAVAEWAMALPAAEPRYAIIGFCWGGSTSFAHATRFPDLATAVVYYGSSPETAALAHVRAPVLGLYGGDDARVNATIPAADSTLRALGRTYEAHVYEGAGHGFLRQQQGRDGANLRATRRAWPATVEWLDAHLRQK